jgi:protein phosphatase
VIAQYTSLTDVGRHRDHNEDALGEPIAFAPRIPGHGWLFAVADGMGGHASGELASLIAIRALFETYYASEATAAEAVIAATLAANSAVHDAGTAALQRAGMLRNESLRMGTTLVACAIRAGRLVGTSVGDSRAYLFRGGTLTRLTHDQTLVAEQVRRGLITDDEAKQSRFRSVLLQALGHATLVQPERFETDLAHEDVVLLCSDGLHGVVDDETIRAHLAAGSIETAARALIDVANANGGPDNISVVLVKCTE